MVGELSRLQGLIARFGVRGCELWWRLAGRSEAVSGVATLVSLICGDCHPKTLVSSHGPLSNIERGPGGGCS